MGTTFLLGVAAIVVTNIATKVGEGALAKVGENIADVAISKLFNFFKLKAPNSSTVKSLEAGHSIDYDKAYSELKLISQDPEAIALLEAVKIQVEANRELAAKVETELNRNSAPAPIVMNNCKGVNGGINDLRNSTFTF